jgi:hypothetical protein
MRNSNQLNYSQLGHAHGLGARTKLLTGSKQT